MADIFSDNVPEDVPTDLKLEDLVGEGRKYQDPDALAKAYANIEGHAATLEKELADLRAAKDLEDAKLKNNPQPPKDGEQDKPKPGDNQPPAPNSSPKDDVDFRSQIRDEVRALNEQERGMANLDTVAKKLAELEGSPKAASELIKRKADELGVTVDWLKETASRSPDAFYNTIGLSRDAVGRKTPTPGSDVRFDNRDNSRGFEFFDKMRKDNPKLYYSASTQREMFESRKKMGEDFYKR